MTQVLVVGGGPAGLVAAIIAARNGAKVTLFEQNKKLGRKLYITGKGRCNLTNDSDVEHHLDQVVSNPKFMYSSFYTFDASAAILFFNELGLKTKVERGGRVFPITDKSSDVIDALYRECKRLKIDIKLNSKVKKLAHDGSAVVGVYIGANRILGDKVVIATGGVSYELTGATGDGYRFAKDSGHRLIKSTAALVPLNTQETWVKDIQGLALKNIELTIKDKKKILYSGFGEMLFTHFGISGPLVLTGSSYLKKAEWPLEALIDLKPTLSFDKLDARILRDFTKYNRRNFDNALDDLLPKKLIPMVIAQSKVRTTKKVDQINKEERHRLVKALKGLSLTLTSKRDLNEAIITQGGVNVKDINPNTMESKCIKGMYFVGEVLDIDALTGGFNLQIAYSTGYLAGISVTEEEG